MKSVNTLKPKGGKECFFEFMDSIINELPDDSNVSASNVFEPIVKSDCDIFTVIKE